MQPSINRLALFQFLTVVYSVFVVGVLLKIKFGSPAPPIFATYLRDYGFVLLLFPAIWFLWASVNAHQSNSGSGHEKPILLSGFILLGLLVILAFSGTMSVAVKNSLVRVKQASVGATPSPKTAAGRCQACS